MTVEGCLRFPVMTIIIIIILTVMAYSDLQLTTCSTV